MSVLLLERQTAISISVARSLAAAGVRTHVLSFDPRGALRYSRHCASYTGIGLDASEDRVMTEAARIARTHAIDVILPVDDPSIRFAAVHKGDLSAIAPLAPVPTVPAYDNAIDKWELSRFLVAHGIPDPGTVLYDGTAKSENAIRSLRTPLLLKPLLGYGGKSISRAESSEEALALLKRNPNTNNQFIVQTLLSGYDIDCSLLAVDGRLLAWTIQRGILPPPEQYAPPAGIVFLRDEEALAVATKVVQQLSWNGVAHIDMHRDGYDGRVKILEFNPRFWNSLLGSTTAGVNFPYLACLTALDAPWPATEYKLCSYIVQRSAAAKQSLRMLVGKGVAGASLTSTSLRYSLPDPLPELVGRLRTLLHAS